MISGKVFYENEAQAIRRDQPAALRSSSVRQERPPTSGPRLQRRRRSADPMHIDPSIIPPGWSYEWKAKSIFNAPVADWTNKLANHWTPVPASRHPDLAVEGENIISRSGTILCERPVYLTDEAKMEDIQEAMKPVIATDDLLFGTPSGHLTRDTPATRARNFINRQYAPGDPREQPEMPDGVMYSEP